MSQIIKTKFSYQEEAYILKEARKGRIVKGKVERINVKIGYNGHGTVENFYAIVNHSVISPPGGMYAEFELSTLEEAKIEAKEYHEASARLHSNKATELI